MATFPNTRKVRADGNDWVVDTSPEAGAKSHYSPHRRTVGRSNEKADSNRPEPESSIKRVHEIVACNSGVFLQSALAGSLV